MNKNFLFVLRWLGLREFGKQIINTFCARKLIICTYKETPNKLAMAKKVPIFDSIFLATKKNRQYENGFKLLSK